jgi:spermidine/putrescine transport system permease protein
LAAFTQDDMSVLTGSFAFDQARAVLWLARLYAGLVVIFMFLPVTVLVVFSFQGGTLPTPPFNGPSLRWFEQVLTSRPILSGLGNSLLVGVLAASFATALGFMAAYGVARHARQWRNVIELFMLVPASISYLIIAMGLLVFYGHIGLRPSLLAVTIGHIVITLPIAFSLIASQFDEGLVRAENAAMDLGAVEWKAILLVTVPMLKWPLITAFCIAFSLSWDEFIIAFMLSRFAVTLPVEIWTSLRSGLNPFINAAGTLVFFISLFIFLALVLSNLHRRVT